jgi:hypothetical protein
MPFHGVDDRAHLPSRLATFFAVRSRAAQRASDRLAVAFKQFGCGES